MRILYGVVGEGMGHAIRSRVVLEHLIARGHQIEIMASGRARDFLSARFADVNDIHGFHLITRDNRVRKGQTLWSNILKGLAGLPKNIAAYFDLIEQFSPEAVISDFESWTYYYGKIHDLPVFSVDNMQVIHRCEHPPEILAGARVDFELTKALVKSKLPMCRHYFITTFFHPVVRKERTSLYPPILRPEITGARVTQGEHLLVYQTGNRYEALARVLADNGLECRVYGMRRDLVRETMEGCLRHRPFSETDFIDDLASARAVIASAGFTLMGESVFLKKPMLAMPIEGQFEQVLNARYLEYEGYGMSGEDGLDAHRLGAFLERVPDYQASLEGFRHDGNHSLLSALDAHLASPASTS
jgi:uncharacterized protein (TIGR00661 family)